MKTQRPSTLFRVSPSAVDDISMTLNFAWSSLAVLLSRGCGGIEPWTDGARSWSPRTRRSINSIKRWIIVGQSCRGEDRRRVGGYCRGETKKTAESIRHWRNENDDDYEAKKEHLKSEQASISSHFPTRINIEAHTKPKQKNGNSHTYTERKKKTQNKTRETTLKDFGFWMMILTRRRLCVRTPENRTNEAKYNKPTLSNHTHDSNKKYRRKKQESARIIRWWWRFPVFVQKSRRTFFWEFFSRLCVVCVVVWWRSSTGGGRQSGCYFWGYWF